jgi:hypothetical protein
MLLEDRSGTEGNPDAEEGPDDVRTNDRTQGSITHKTAYITPETLRAALDEWMDELNGDHARIHDSDPQRDDSHGRKEDSNAEPRPILIVALHACGSLTPDILRTYLAGGGRGWKPAALVVVGCCYNLLREEGENCSIHTHNFFLILKQQKCTQRSHLRHRLSSFIPLTRHKGS